MIKKVDKYILIGTSHVSQESIDRIKKAFEENELDLVCLELDYNRLDSLLNNKEVTLKDHLKLLKRIGPAGYLFYIIAGTFQKKIGKKIGMKPGIDMLTGYNIAREKKIPVALIDLPIDETLKKISKISIGKKLSILTKFFTSGFKKDNKELLNFDIKTIPKEELIFKMLELLKKETPELYKILIEDRNEYMVNKLIKLREKHEKNILVIVGAGHVEGMEKLLKEKINYYNFKFTLEDESKKITYNFDI